MGAPNACRFTLEFSMLIRVPVRHDPLPSEITPRRVWDKRRDLIRMAAAGIALPLASGSANGQTGKPALKLAAVPGPFATTDKPTSYRDVTTYNNFYEFGLEKD
jgi:sulfoxide reductase catalytic subunit YedY